MVDSKGRLEGQLIVEPDAIDTKDPVLSSNAFQDSDFVKGYTMCRIKNGIDPIPPYLPATNEWRKWMAGWNSCLVELGIISKINIQTRNR